MTLIICENIENELYEPIASKVILKINNIMLYKSKSIA